MDIHRERTHADFDLDLKPIFCMSLCMPMVSYGSIIIRNEQLYTFRMP